MNLIRVAHLAAFLTLVVSHTLGQQRELSSLWNGTWTEDTTRSSIFVPGLLWISRVKGHGTYLVSQDGERRVVQCVPAEHSRATGTCAKLVPAEGTTIPTPMGSVRAGIVYKISADGKELVVQHWRIVPDGTRLTDNDIYRRRLVNVDVTGRWHKVHSSEAPTTYRLTVKGSYLTIALPDGEFTLVAKLDGSPTPFRGASIPATSPARDGYTVIGPFKLLETNYRDKEVVAHSRITLSADGKTLTERHTQVGSSQHTVEIVFRRQE